MGGGGGLGFYAKFFLHMAYVISNVSALRPLGGFELGIRVIGF